MTANIEIPNALLDELNLVAECIGVPVEKCATEAIARWLQREGVVYVDRKMNPPERPKLELVGK